MPNQRAKAAQRPMTKAHKEALAKGREEGRAVRQYLEALAATKRRRGRQRTPASIEKRLAAIESELAAADPLSHLHLLQERKNLQAELSRRSDVKDVSDLEKKFVKVAKAYGERKGISYGTWRAAGVSAATLEKARITRTRG
ncbi:MAG: hypothetical protein M0Z95_06635 [Actinomycetota bacterium]|nr:hypothetical protein [Actinomycetota bacterium]